MSGDLRDAFSVFMLGVAVFHFNLACYAVQLGELDRSKIYLSRAIEVRPDLRLRALEDEDLRPLWNIH